MASKTKTTSARKSDETLKTISHEARMDILRICCERLASPNEMAKELELDLGKVSHHVKVLRDEGALQLVKTEPRRGAVEHYYRAMVPAMFDDEAWAKLPAKLRPIVYRTIFQAMVAEGAAAEVDGAFGATDAHLSWVVLELDAQGREELTALNAEWLKRIEKLKQKSRERLAGSANRTEEIVAAMMGYKRAPRPGSRSELSNWIPGRPK